VYLPSLPEQQRIVDLIGSLDETIEAADEVAMEGRGSLEHFGNDAVERSAARGWPTVTLSEALGEKGVIQTGPFGSQLHQSDYVETGTPVVMPANMRDGQVVLSGMSMIGDSDVERLSRHRLRSGDIAWSRRGDVTRFAVIGDDEAGMICGTGCLLVRAEQPALSAWLAVWLATTTVSGWLVDNAVGATMANLNTGILAKVPVSLPPLSERASFIGAVEALNSSIEASQSYAASLRNLRTNLLTALLSGTHEIPVSYDDLLSEAV